MDAQVGGKDPAGEATSSARALLQAGRFADAARSAAETARNWPQASDALYIQAVAQRYLGDHEGALRTLANLKAVRPGYGRASQEEGHVHRAAGQPAAAIAAYQQAVAANPALPASWNALAELLREQGDEAAASRARAQHERLAALPPELVSVASFMHEDRLWKAEQLCRAFLRQQPHHPEAMRLLANLGLRLHVLDDAEYLLESVLEMAPGFLLARIDYVHVLQRRQKYQRAREEARKVRDSEPDNPAFEMLYANQCMATGDYQSALDIYDRLIAAHPDNPELHLVRGHARKTIGRQADAIMDYQSAAAIRPSFGDAWWSLANLKTWRFPDAQVADLEKLVAREDLRLVDRYHLSFALGKALEDRAEYAAAFAAYEQGNRLKKRELRYDADRMAHEFELQKIHCQPELFERHAGHGAPAPDPIFIVGMPRAGSTLLEQILASHPQVDGTLELPHVLAIAHRLNGRRKLDEEALYPAILKDLDPGKLRQLGEEYLRETRLYRQGAAYFTDKMPNNFRHIGLIRLMLPNARIIDARRHPMACCFSGFKQLFAEGQEFSYGLTDIGRYYRDYVSLMDHWDRVFPGVVLRVQYEDVVADLEGQVRRMLDFCGLDFHPACLEFHRTRREVRTASSEQVRSPLYASGVDQWRHFEPWLEPLKEALGPALSAGSGR
ncbi:MAG: sulfotransferase [Chromatiales bacterium]|nr:sulfotransferase [Chromatiales bacterium]